MSSAAEPGLARWRLVLGHYAQRRMQGCLTDAELRMERALDFLYSREYQGRDVRRARGPGERGTAREGSLDPSQLTVPLWLGEVRRLFPRETAETVERHALERYELKELVTDPQTLDKLEPNLSLVKTLLTFKGQLTGEVLEVAQRIVRQVVDELKEKLTQELSQAMSGQLNRSRHSPLKVAQNFDWRGTLRANLKHYDDRRQTLAALEQVRFFSRTRRRLPWTLILCIDQSGSMLGSVIHSAVMAGIFAGLPALNVRLVVFDTSVADLSDQVDDPVKVLMSVQLGGGTDIGQALCYCERLVEVPSRTAVVLVSDFCEGAPPRRMLGAVKRLNEAGVRLIGLAALDEDASAAHDAKMAERLAAIGMQIAALTPKQLARWLVQTMS